MYTERRNAGAFDIDFASTSQDPSPSGLTQGWSCEGRTNVARYCDPAVDSLIDAAIRTREGAGAGLARRAAAHRGRRAGRLHVHPELHVRREPAIHQRAHPAGIGVARPARMDRRPQGRDAPRGTEVRRWLLRRALQSLVTLVVALVILFLLMHILPGDPLSRVGEAGRSHPSRSRRCALATAWTGRCSSSSGASWSGSSTGDLGMSIEYGRPVTGLLLERLPATLLLGGTVLLLNFTVGLWLGVRQAVRKDSPRTAGSPRCRWPATRRRRSGWAWCWRGWSGCSWRLLPPAGMRDPLLDAGGLSRRPSTSLRHLVLPALTLSVVSIAGTMRYQRTAMLEALRLPYILTARAKGLTERRWSGARVAERAVPGADAVRAVAPDPGQRLGVRRVGVRLAGSRLAGRRGGREPGLSPAHGRRDAGGQAWSSWPAFSRTSPTPLLDPRVRYS